MRTVTQREPEEQPDGGKKAEGWLHVRVRREVRKQVNIHAAQEEISVAEVVERALEKYLGIGKAA